MDDRKEWDRRLRAAAEAKDLYNKARANEALARRELATAERKRLKLERELYAANSAVRALADTPALPHTEGR